MYIIYAILAAFSAGLVAIFGKIGLERVDTTLATTIRAIVMAAILLLTSLALRKWNLSQIDSRAFLYIFLAGLAGAASWLFYFLALKSGPATAVAALDRLSVVFVLILAALFLNENLTVKTVIGGILVVIGALLFI
jgi:transporter family protein